MFTFVWRELRATEFPATVRFFASAMVPLCWSRLLLIALFRLAVLLRKAVSWLT